jgi:hypothetical protein
MLRDVVVHINNEQPMLADLIAEPSPSDVALICRNLRTMNGKKPVWVDKADSTFVMPLAAIRFIEIHRFSVEAHRVELAAEAAGATSATLTDVELANDAIARLDWGGDPGTLDDVPVQVKGSDLASERPNADELDDDLLRRIREA